MKSYLRKGGEKMQDNRDELLRERIKEMNTLPDSVNQKIEDTLGQLSRKGEFAMKRRKKWVPIAAAVLITLFLGGNGIAYAMGQPNLFSFVLSKFNISSEYEEVAKEVGVTQVSGGVEITVTDLGVDHNLLIIGYQIKGNSITQSPFFLTGRKTITDEKGKEIDINYHSTGKKRGKQQIEKIAENEFRLYEIYPLMATGKNSQLTLSLEKVQFYTPNEYGVEYGEEISGKWNFSIPVSLENTVEGVEYQPKEATFELSPKEKIVFNRIRVNQIGTILDMTAHTDRILTMQIKNRSGEILLAKDAQEIVNGQNSIMMKRISDDSNLLVEIYVYDTDQKLKEGTLVLAGNEKREKEQTTQKQTATLGSMKLTFPKKWEVNKEQENTLLLVIYQEYQNKQKEFDSYVKIQKVQNKEKLSLSEIKTKEILAEEIAYDIRSENYFAYDSLRKQYSIIDEKDFPKEKGNKFMMTKEEIYEILEGKKEAILKGNIKVTKQELEDILEPGFEVQGEENMTISGRDAYRLTIRTDGGTQEVVLIGSGNYYYKITYLPTSKEKVQIEKMIEQISFS